MKGREWWTVKPAPVVSLPCEKLGVCEASTVNMRVGAVMLKKLQFPSYM